jgi:hypothetical protein
MKIGDYVAKIENKWQVHNPWMEFPDEPPVPLGIIVSKSTSREVGVVLSVLESCGKVASWHKSELKVISDNRAKDS